MIILHLNVTIFKENTSRIESNPQSRPQLVMWRASPHLIGSLKVSHVTLWRPQIRGSAGVNVLKMTHLFLDFRCGQEEELQFSQVWNKGLCIPLHRKAGIYEWDGTKLKSELVFWTKENRRDVLLLCHKCIDIRHRHSSPPSTERLASFLFCFCPYFKMSQCEKPVGWPPLKFKQFTSDIYTTTVLLFSVRIKIK